MELDPCPFCNSTAEVHKMGDSFYIECRSCWCSYGLGSDSGNVRMAMFKTEEIAIKKWNSRSSYR